MKNLNQLINKCLNNDRKAQKELYEQYFGFLMSVCFRYENNYQDAVALLNQAYFQIISKLETFDSTRPFEPWIKRIAVNTSIDHLRKKKRFVAHNVFLEDDQWEEQAAFSQDEVEDIPELSYDELIQILNTLEEPARTIFNLFAIDELQHGEIAERLNISIRTSKRYLNKARQELRVLILEKRKMIKQA